MDVLEHTDFYGYYRKLNSGVLIVGFSGSGIIEINNNRSEPTLWMEPFFRDRQDSVLTLTARDIHMWPQSCLDTALEHFDVDLSQFEAVVCIGFSMGGWGAIANAQRLGADRVFALSPRTPYTSVSCTDPHYGPARPPLWDHRTEVTVLTDRSMPWENLEAEIIGQFGACRVMNVPGFGHNTMPLLRRVSSANGVLDAWLMRSLTQQFVDATVRSLKAKPV